MAKKKIQPKDRAYRLLGNYSPLSMTIPTRHTSITPLLYYDEETNTNRPLRYATNQRSPFEDEQDGNAIMGYVVFEDGTLFVPKSNPVLQEFLYYHPMSNVIFEEIDNERDAQEELDSFNVEIEAMSKAKELTIDEIEIMYRVIFERDPSRMSSMELRRDVFMYAKNYPAEFIKSLNNPNLRLQSKVFIFFDKGLLSFRNGNKEVWYNTPSNKKRMLVVPYGEDPYLLVTTFLKSDDGLEALRMLDTHLEGK
jgi:hypothetical protein